MDSSAQGQVSSEASGMGTSSLAQGAEQRPQLSAGPRAPRRIRVPEGAAGGCGGFESSFLRPHDLSAESTESFTHSCVQSPNQSWGAYCEPGIGPRAGLRAGAGDARVQAPPWAHTRPSVGDGGDAGKLSLSKAEEGERSSRGAREKSGSASPPPPARVLTTPGPWGGVGRCEWAELRGQGLASQGGLSLGLQGTHPKTLSRTMARGGLGSEPAPGSEWVGADRRGRGRGRTGTVATRTERKPRSTGVYQGLSVRVGAREEGWAVAPPEAEEGVWVTLQPGLLHPGGSVLTFHRADG